MTTCSKNGIKKEGESCSLNNNCTYPDCLEKSFTEKDMIDFAEWCANSHFHYYYNGEDWNWANAHTQEYCSTKELLQKFLIRKK